MRLTPNFVRNFGHAVSRVVPQFGEDLPVERGGLIFAGIRMMTGRFQDAIPGLFGALFGAGVLGWGAGWIGSLTGQSM